MGIKIAQAEVSDVIADVNQAQQHLEPAYVRSPQDGQILKYKPTYPS